MQGRQLRRTLERVKFSRSFDSVTLLYLRGVISTANGSCSNIFVDTIKIDPICFDLLPTIGMCLRVSRLELYLSLDNPTIKRVGSINIVAGSALPKRKPTDMCVPP